MREDKKNALDAKLEGFLDKTGAALFTHPFFPVLWAVVTADR